jgi:hypothetical protein
LVAALVLGLASCSKPSEPRAQPKECKDVIGSYTRLVMNADAKAREALYSCRSLKPDEETLVLAMALRYGDSDDAATLLKRGASPGRTGEKGTALIGLVATGDPQPTEQTTERRIKVLELLAHAGADP